MKIEKLRKNIIINASASVILLSILGAIFFYTLKRIETNNKNIDVLKSSIVQIKTKTIELEGKIKDAKKYKEIWEKISDNKKAIQAVKIDDINKILQEVSEKYDITATNIQVILPIILNDGIFKRQTITVAYTTGTLSFNSLDDVRALLFMKEFFTKLPGYLIITYFDLSKTGNYSQEDLVSISTGKEHSLTKAKVSFSWYTYREK